MALRRSDRAITLAISNAPTFLPIHRPQRQAPKVTPMAVNDSQKRKT